MEHYLILYVSLFAAAVTGVGGFLALWSKISAGVAEKVNLQRDVEDLKEKFSRLDRRDGRIFDELKTISSELHDISERLVRLETVIAKA